MHTKFSVFFASVFLATISTAVEAAPAVFLDQVDDRCNDVLKEGTFQTSRYRENTFFQQIIYSRFLSSTYEQSKNDRSLGFGVPVGELIFKGDYNEEQFNQRKQDIQRTFLNHTTATNEIDVALASGDSVIVNAWTECMRAAGGRIVLRFIPVNPTTVFTELAWLPGKAGSDTGVVRTRLLDTVQLPDGATFRDGANCFRRRAWVSENVCRSTIVLPSAATPLAFSVNAQHGSAQAYLPARLTLKREERPFQFQPAHALRLTGHRGYQEDSRTAQLTQEQLDAGWRFDPTTAKFRTDVVYQNRWVHFCDHHHFSADLYKFTYGFRAVGVTRNPPDRNSSIVCEARPEILMYRESWVPTQAAPDAVNSPPIS